MKTMKILLAGLIFIIMTACSSNPDDWEEGVLDIDYGQKATTGLFYKINIDGPIKKTFERKSGDDNIHERVSAGNYTIYVTAYSDPEYKTVYAVGSGVAEVKAGEFINVSVIPITTSSVKVITAFTFLTTPVSIGIIDEEAKTISVEVPFGTDVKNLTPTIIYAGKSCTPTGAQNFTGPVTYTVTALDDSSVNYTVTVTVQPIPEEYTTKSITAFTFLTTPVSIGIINEKAKTISVEVPFGTDVKNLTPTIIYAGKSYTPIGVQDFTGPVTYTVTALDDSSVEYTVTVTVKANSAKAITTFIFPTTPVSIGIINESTKTINVEVPFNTDVTNLTPTITHTGKSYTPTGAQDFTGPVIYTVTALDDSSVEYTVTVAVKAITAFTFPTNPISIGIIDEGAKTINVSVPFGTDVTKLTPSVIYKGISYSPTGQQNFTSPVTYAVTALNGSTVTYKVTVTVREPAQWARSTQTAPDRSVFNAVAVDNDGNVYAAGYQEGNGTFNYGDGVTAKGAYNASYNVVLVKYNSSGTALWARSTQTAPSESEFNAVAVDNDGNVYAAGYQDGGGTFNYGDGVTATGGYGYSLGNVVLVKYNSSGTALWARSTQPAPDYSRFNAVAVDNDGNVYAAGYQVRNGTFNYGDGVTATALWARSTQTAPYESRFNAVAVDNDGNVYAAGYQNDGGTFNYGDGVTATGGYDRSSIINGSHYNVVLVKYNSSGTALWARSTQTAPSESEFSAVAVDNAGNVYAAGYQRDSGTFNYGGDATAKGAYGGGTSYRYNVVLVKYNSSGTGLWARSTQVAPFYSQFRAVAVDNDGNVYAVGYQVNNGTFNFNYGGGATTANYANSYNVVLVKYNSLGTGLWARSTQAATNHSAFNAVTVDNNGNVYAAGYQNNNGTFNYGGDATTGGYYDGGYNVVLVKYRE